MPTVAKDIINKALRSIGIAPITTLGVDGTPQDILMNDIYADVWKEVFRLAGVNTTRTRVELKYTSMALTLSSGAVLAGVTATAASAIFSARDVGSELREFGTGATGVATITAYTSPTVVTVENTVAWLSATPAANKWRIDPVGEDFTYAYEMPSGFISAIELDDLGEYTIEGNRLLANNSGAILHFHWYESDPDIWEPTIKQAIIDRLALRGAWPLTNSQTAVNLASALWQASLLAAQGHARAEIQPQGRISRRTLLDVR